MTDSEHDRTVDENNKQVFASVVANYLDGS